MSTRAALRVALVLVSLTAACGGGEATADNPRSSDALTMRLESEPYPCVNACALPRRVLSGSEVRMTAQAVGDEANDLPTPFSTNEAVARIVGSRLSCSCGPKATPIEQAERCEGSLVKWCSYALRLAVQSPGDVEIQMSTTKGKLVDVMPLVVRDAVRLAPIVTAAGPPQTRPGRYLVYEGETITILPVPEDQDGQRLVHHEPVSVLGSSSAAVEVDPADGTRAMALELGTSTVTVSLRKASSVKATVELDVVAR